jgi:hypothetical protein
MALCSLAALLAARAGSAAQWAIVGAVLALHALVVMAVRLRERRVSNALHF